MDEALVGGTPGPAFVPSSIEVYASVMTAPAEPGVANSQTWPLDVSFEAMTEAGAGFRCVMFEGEKAKSLLDVFGKANQATSFVTADGTEYSIGVRPLFPEQTSTCSQG
jgi:hypothetical protein